MVKVDCKQKLADKEGKPTEQTIGQVLSELMWVSRDNQARSYVLAKKFGSEDFVELKAEDVVFVSKTIATLGVQAGIAGQLLMVLGESVE